MVKTITPSFTSPNLSLNVSFNAPSIEKGERNVSIDILDKLARALNIDISEFFKK
jgi:transcriptional regulator with XRE-family HTH domain